MKLLRHLLACVLLLGSVPAFAVNYVFPGNMPAGCTRSGNSNNYSCPGGGGLAYGDTVTINAPFPANITVTGSMSTNNARINEGGSAANLNLVVQGTLTAEYQAVINGNLTATSINGTGSEVVYGGNVTVNGTATLAYRTRVAGNISATGLTAGGQVQFGGNVSTTSGAMVIGDTSTVAGNLSSGAGSIQLISGAQVAGTVNCNCALTMESQTRVTGNITASSVTSTSQAYLMGSVTTTGAVDLAYGATLGGAITAGSTIRLRGNTQAPQCLRSTTASAIQLDWADRANGGVCCGAANACTAACVVNNSGAATPSLCSPSGSTPPSRFNAFETSTLATATTGVIRTKVSGNSFSVAIVAVNSAGTGVATTFTGNVRVEVLDASNNNGNVNGTTNCRPNWSQAAGTSSTTLNFAASDLGRKNVTLTVPDSFRDARIRVTYPDTGTATATGCSTDAFAIRPSTFGSFGVTDATSSTAGTGRSLANVGVTGGIVHRAGQPFTVRATALNAAASPATTANYNGTPAAVRTACVGTACGGVVDPNALTLNTTASNGVISTSTATYSEGGAFSLQLVDSTWAAVDASDGSTAAEMNITSAVLAVGRFVPNSLAITTLVAPQLRTFNSSTCAARSFTYLGQPFGWALAPQAIVTGLNAAGVAIANYPDVKLTGLTRTQAYAPLVSASPGLDSSSAANLPGITGNGNGTGVLAAPTGDSFTMVRPAAPVTPFSADISLTWNVSDESETGVAGNGSITTPGPFTFADIAFDGSGLTPDQFRYGQLRIASAYGSELTPLAVPLELQYWNGTNFVTNAADQCTSLPTSALSLANYRGSLATCRTAPTGTSVAFTNGRGVLRLAAPGNPYTGSVDGTLQLGAIAPPGAQRCSAPIPTASAAVAANMPWLQIKAPGGTTYTTNPSARFSFGQYRSPLIHQRELY